MKPRTKIQKEIVALSNQLPPLTKKQEEWALKNATAHIGFFNKQRIWCTECGCSVPLLPKVDLTKDDLQDPGKTFVCPCCGAKLEVCKSRKIKNESREYVTYVTTCGDYQVLRHFMLFQYSRREEPTRHFFCEAVQEWINPNGKVFYIARSRSSNPYYYDCWSFSSKMELREPSGYSSFAYSIDGSYIYPYMRVLPKLKKYGFKSSFHRITPSSLLSALLSEKENVEWMLKARQYGLLDYLLRYYNLPYRDSVKICIRNHYQIKDVTIWRDYLDCLNYFHMDLHNAHYVCPKNLRQAHDCWMKKKDKAEKKRKEEEKRMNAAKWEEQYAKTKGKFLGIAFSCPGINVTVLPSVAAFVEEADHMHHCVYANGYYKKPESLILSAKDDKGKRLETIEVNLKTFSIVQCYGACNKFTPQHEQIKELVNKNMNLIRKAV